MTAGSRTRFRVLLVEDEPGDTRALLTLLSTVGEGGAEVEHVGCVEDALAYLDRETAIDLVLLDLGLPGLTSLDALRAVRARAPHVAVVVLTASDDADVALLSVALGAQDVLVKGVTDGATLTRSIAFARQRQQILSRVDGARLAAIQGNEAKSQFGGVASHDLRTEVPETSTGELAGLRVLMVDDSEESSALVAAYLARSGAELEVSDNARSALERLACETFDVVLMDLHLPGMDGFAATRELRRVEAERATRPVPVIAMSADTLPKTVKHALACGFSDHLAKPTQKADLLAMIRRYVPREAARPLPLRSPRSSTATALLPKFMGHRERDVGTLRDALARTDFDVISTLAHNMRGNGVSYGFPEVSEIGRCLEDAAKSRDGRVAAQQIALLENCLQRIRRELNLAAPPPSRPSSSTRVRAAAPAPGRKTGDS